MKTFKQNRRLATTLAVGVLGLASTGAFAMTSDHDTQPNGADRKDAILATSAEDDSDQVATNVIGGPVGNLPLPKADK